MNVKYFYLPMVTLSWLGNKSKAKTAHIFKIRETRNHILSNTHEILKTCIALTLMESFHRNDVKPSPSFRRTGNIPSIVMPLFSATCLVAATKEGTFDKRPCLAKLGICQHGNSILRPCSLTCYKGYLRRWLLKTDLTC